MGISSTDQTMDEETILGRPASWPYITPEGHMLSSRLSRSPLISPHRADRAAVLHHPFISKPPRGSRSLLCCPRPRMRGLP